MKNQSSDRVEGLEEVIPPRPTETTYNPVVYLDPRLSITGRYPPRDVVYRREQVSSPRVKYSPQRPVQSKVVIEEEEAFGIPFNRDEPPSQLFYQKPRGYHNVRLPYSTPFPSADGKNIETLKERNAASARR
jgi:hypothetical protein